MCCGENHVPSVETKKIKTNHALTKQLITIHINFIKDLAYHTTQIKYKSDPYVAMVTTTKITIYEKKTNTSLYCLNNQGPSWQEQLHMNIQL